MILWEEYINRLPEILLKPFKIAFNRKIKINFISKIIRRHIRKMSGKVIVRAKKIAMLIIPFLSIAHTTKH